MGKFSRLAAKVDQPFLQEIDSPLTGEVLRDSDGKACFISVYSTDSAIGRKFDEDQRTAQKKLLRAGGDPEKDQLQENIEKCAALTHSWHLVDPNTLEPIDEECTPENARLLYSEPGMGWLFTPAWLAAIRIANFMKRPSKDSSDTAKPSGETAAS